MRKKRIEKSNFEVYNIFKAVTMKPKAESLQGVMKGGSFMLTLQEQVVQKVNRLSEDNLYFLLELIDRFMQPDLKEKKAAASSQRIGIAKGQKLYDDEYDFDEMNPEIAKLFGGLE